MTFKCSHVNYIHSNATDFSSLNSGLELLVQYADG